MRLPARYSPAQKWLHWTIAALIIIMVAVGLTMVRLPDGALKNTLYELHKSTGLIVITLAFVRIAVRLSRGAPPLEPGIPAWQRFAAHVSHYALYMLIVLVPLAGWTATSYCCKPVNLFWTVPLSLPVPDATRMEAAKPLFLIHYGLAFTLIGIAAIHISAAFQHHFIRRDRTLRRMLPETD